MRLLGSITNRIFLASTLLSVLSIGAAVSFVSARLTRQTEAELQRDIAKAATLVDEQQHTQFDNVTRTAHLIADLPKFKAVVDIGDRPTLAPIATDYQRQAGADLLQVTGRRGELLAVAGEEAVRGALDPAQRSAQAHDGPAEPVFWPHARGVMEVVTVPVTVGLARPDMLGSLSLGYLLDERRAAQFKALTGADIAFAIGGVVRASTLGPDAAPALASLLSARNPTRVTIDRQEWVALARPLGARTGVLEPTAVILQSRSDRMRTLNAIQRALGGIALGAVLLAMLVSYGVARTITRPLAAITDQMRQVAATGDLTRRIPMQDKGGWDDDDARMLATTFNSLTESVARFQREAAQRERLSSLGRLSTVIAHEVRNPLMIIKGSLRSLARGGATHADIREAAADIDDEINRLNRLVNDVLDVARPIRFEASPTDINAVCRNAVAAATGNRDCASVALDLSPAITEVMTDGDRLRAVLVNLLANAQQAVEGADSAEASDDPRIRLSTEPLEGRRVAITVSDAGVGIPPDVLPRIFDPYFTTRRTGTGLGLAIAKNIVEGLGGTIVAMTRRGQGTEFRIELGDAPAGQEL